jgi:hypothetical protein
VTEPIPDHGDDVRPTGRRNARLGQTVADMTRSLVVVLVVVGAILLVTWRPQPEAVKTIDPTTALVSARVVADFEILYPAGLNPDWRNTSARWDTPPTAAPDAAWHLGFVTPADAYAQLGQSATTNADYLADQTAGGRLTGDDFGPWQRYATGANSAEPTRSLVQIVNGVTIVVSGTAEWAELEFFADRLSPSAFPDPGD